MASRMAGIKKRATRQRALAQENIRIYFEEAQKRVATAPDLAHRYMRMARNMAMRFRVPIPSDLCLRMCKHCRHYLVPGRNARIRVEKGMRIILCKDCKHISRFRYK